ncbi:hypothetical protein GA0070560_1176 [Micromonospora halophytica]|uniref:Uncharacterized protein n=1 Tax=Micromonospora halophytica TaxID=47864 RepID=A0A1C5IV74_9ACTN|nr:hypothetical protein GA0070560_1176 [Micromonospora halophytica]
MLVARNAGGRRRGTEAAYRKGWSGRPGWRCYLHGRFDLAPIRHHQLFSDRMKYRRASGPVHTRDRRARPHRTAPPAATAHQRAAGIGISVP